MHSDNSLVETLALKEVFAPGYKSVESTERVDIRFINFATEAIDLCWVDFEGNIIRYFKLNSGQSIRITTYTGHCWIARFVRNGAPAHFSRNSTEVFKVARTASGRTELVTISRKVPTLLEATVEYFGEQFRTRQRDLIHLPIPETLKDEIRFYISRKRIYQSALFFLPLEIHNLHPGTNADLRRAEQLEARGENVENGHHSEDVQNPYELSEVFVKRQIDLCLQVISSLSNECSDFKISEIFLKSLGKEFVMMGFSTTYNYAVKWIDSMVQNASGLRNHCLLLKQLVCSTDLLQNKQLQGLLYEALPRTYLHLLSTKQYSAASVVVEVMFYAVSVPAAYSDDCDRTALKGIWGKFLDSKEPIKSAHLYLCTILVMTSLGFDCTQYIRVLSECVMNDLEEDDDVLFSPKRQFFALLEANLGAILSRCSSEQIERLLNVLIAFHLENNNLNLLVQKIFGDPELASTYASQVLKQFFRCLLFKLSAILNGNSSQQKEHVGDWIKKCSQEILFTQAKSGEDGIDSWKSLMSAVVLASSHTTLSDSRINQVVQTLCGEGFSLEALPISIRLAIFCSLVLLVPCFSSEMFIRTVESISLIMRSELKLFRSILSYCKEKTSKKYIGMLLYNGYSNGNLKSAQNVAKEFLISSSDLSMLSAKCDAVLKESAQQSSVEKQCYYLKAVCDALGEIHPKTKAEQRTALRNYVEKVFRHVYGLAAPVDCSNAPKMVIFELALSLLLHAQTLQSRDSAADEEGITFVASESIAEHAEIVDQLCKTVCKHPERLEKLGIKSEQLSQLLKTSVTWMIGRGKISRVMSWKYAKNFELYDEDVIKTVITIAPVEMLESLLHSLSGSDVAMKKFALYSALAKHENEKKRKLLFAVLDDILLMVADVAEVDYLKAVRFLQHIFPIAAGSVYEKDFVSFAQALLSSNAELFTSDLNALSSNVALLLDCLRFFAHSLVNDQCALYAKLFVCVIRAVQKYADEDSTASPQLIRYLTYGLAKIAHAMLKHERSFSRIAPFIISECLEDAKYTSLALFRIFSMCDRYSIALLTTSLPPLQKARFAHLCPQFTKINKIVV